MLDMNYPNEVLAFVFLHVPVTVVVWGFTSLAVEQTAYGKKMK